MAKASFASSASSLVADKALRGRREARESRSRPWLAGSVLHCGKSKVADDDMDLAAPRKVSLKAQTPTDASRKEAAATPARAGRALVSGPTREGPAGRSCDPLKRGAFTSPMATSRIPRMVARPRPVPQQPSPPEAGRAKATGEPRPFRSRIPRRVERPGAHQAVRPVGAAPRRGDGVGRPSRLPRPVRAKTEGQVLAKEAPRQRSALLRPLDRFRSSLDGLCERLAGLRVSGGSRRKPKRVTFSEAPDEVVVFERHLGRE